MRLKIDGRISGEKLVDIFNIKTQPTCQLRDWGLHVGALIGEGSFASVRQATWLGHPVALKVMKSENEITDETSRIHARSDFLNEIQFNAILGCHPNIIPFYGTCCVIKDPVPCPCGIIFERMSDGTLDVKKYGGNGKVVSSIRVSLCVARALMHAHALGIMHRDVKPSNVFMSENCVAKLGDWGLAEFTDRKHKTRDTGTAEFMAPEVYVGTAGYNEKADVFSFGLLMYALGTGENYPYASQYITPTQAVMAVVERSFRPPVPSYFDLDYSELLEKCWAQDPEHRPSMADVAEALSILLENKLRKSTTVASSSSWATWFGFNSS